MSVPEGNRKESVYEPILKARELAIYTFRITANQNVFLPDFSDDVTKPIKKLTLGIYMRLYNANRVVVTNHEFYIERWRLQHEAVQMCNELLAMIQFAKRLFHLSSRRVKFWGGYVVSIRCCISDNIESERSRYRQYAR